ncbi:Transcription factor iws1 [Rhizophlyctis rosea]|nr:Transcription factor iws1 [Rhizophlyctis rosea]
MSDDDRDERALLENEIFGGSDDELLDSDDDREPSRNRARSASPLPSLDEAETGNKDADYQPLPSFKKRKAREGDEDGERRTKKIVRRKKRVSRSRPVASDFPAETEREPEPELQGRAKAEKEFDDFVGTITGKGLYRRSKQDSIDTGADEQYRALADQMQEAAVKDQDMNREKKPGLAKLMLLPAVMTNLQKEHLFEVAVENEILLGIKSWLEPLSDGSLPNYNVQKSMMTILERMTARKEINKEVIVNFYTKCERVNEEIRRSANALIDNWARPILGRSANLREKDMTTAAAPDYATPPPKAHASRPRSLAEASSSPKPVMPKAAGEKDKPERATMPFPVATAFRVAPASTVTARGGGGERSGGGGKGQPQSQYRRLDSKLRLMAQKGARWEKH